LPHDLQRRSMVMWLSGIESSMFGGVVMWKEGFGKSA
jgi:hypothetical protein